MSWYLFIDSISKHVEESSTGKWITHCAMDDIHSIYILLKKRYNSLSLLWKYFNVFLGSRKKM